MHLGEGSFKEVAPNVFAAWSINSKNSNYSHLTRTMQMDKEKEASASCEETEVEQQKELIVNWLCSSVQV